MTQNGKHFLQIPGPTNVPDVQAKIFGIKFDTKLGIEKAFFRTCY